MSTEDKQSSGQPFLPFDSGETESSMVSENRRSWMDRTFGPLKPGSLRGSTFTIISCTIGAGIMTLPGGFMHAGIILGPLILLTVAMISYLGVVFVTQAADRYKLYTYVEIVDKALGPVIYKQKAKLILQLNVIVYGFGSLIGYQILVGTFVPSIFASLGIEGDSASTLRIIFMVALCSGVIFPLALFKSLTAFRFTSLLGTFSIIFLTFVVVCEFPFFISQNNYSQDLILFKVDKFIFSTFSVCLYAYSCHINLPQIQGEMINSNERRILKASSRALLVVLFPYLLTGCFGYMSTLNDTPNLIIMRDAPDSISNDWVMTVAKGFMSMTLILAIPLRVIPCRKQIFRVVFRMEKEPSRLQHVALTFTLCFSTLIVGIFYPKIMVMMNFLGGFCSSAYSIIFPALIGVHLSGKPYTHWLNALILAITAFLALCGWTSIILAVIYS